MIGASQRGWIGVDVGMHTVKVVQTERRAGQLCVKEALAIRRPEAWSDTTDDFPPTASSADEIRAALSLGSRFVGRAAAVALPMNLCEVSNCLIPPGRPDERRDLVAQELQAKFGDASGLREFDYWEAELPGDSDSENVLAASMPRDWAQQVTRDLAGAGLTGRVLDVLPLALARAVELGKPGCSRSPVAAVDWGFRRATLCAVLHGRPLFVRCLRDCGFAALLSALTGSLSLTPDEGQKLLNEHGLPAEGQHPTDEISQVIEEVTSEPVNALIGELQKTISFLRHQRRALAPTKIVLFGGGAATRNIGPFLSRKLELPVEPWRLEGWAPPTDRAQVAIELLGPAIALSSLAWTKA